MSRSSGSRITRVSADFDQFLNEFSMNLTRELNRPVSRVEASDIIAKKERLGASILEGAKKKRRGDPEESIFHL